MFGHYGPEVVLFKSKEKAYRFAFKWIMERTGGPQAWQPDEWPQMREAIVKKDVAAMAEYYTDSFHDQNKDYIMIEQIPVR